MYYVMQVVPVGLLGRTVSKIAFVRMVASAHHLGVCALVDGAGLIAHIVRVSTTLLHAQYVPLVYYMYSKPKNIIVCILRDA